MRRLIAALILALMAGEPAAACRIYVPIALEDVRFADVVVIGRVTNYRIIRDEAFRRRMLSNPNLSEEMRRHYTSGESLLPDFARFEVEVVERLSGSVPRRFSVTWDNSTFGEPERMSAGAYLIALRRPSSLLPPLRGPSAYIGPSPDPNSLTLLQAPCSRPFLFESGSAEAHTVRRLIGTSRR